MTRLLIPKRWSVETIENHIDLLTGFPFDSSGYVSKGVNICGGLIIMPQKSIGAPVNTGPKLLDMKITFCVLMTLL